MSTVELKDHIHKIVESIEDEQLLQAIFDFLKSKDTGKPGRLWSTLTEKQKSEVLRSFEESEDDSNLIDRDQVL